MSKSGITGFLFLCAAFIVLCYQAIFGALRIDTAGEFIYKNIALVDVLDGKYLHWIDSLQPMFIKRAAEFLITMPLFFLLLCIAAIFFLIQALKRVK